MVDILIDYRQRQKIRADFKNFLYIAFKYINLPPPTQIQYDIADALQYGWEDTIIEGFRGVAKSTITGCYADWKFDNDPENYQLLELSANQTEACKFLKFSRDLLTIIPFLNYLIPDKANGQRDSALQFDVRPAIPRIQPSCKALGIFGQITGNRAVEIIADDIETSQNCDTMVKREAIRKAVTEFSPVLRPLKGRVLYLGTPHTETSIYNEEEARGCRVQIFPIKYPNAIEIEKYKGNLSTAIATRLENNPELVGKPTDPLRFDEDTIIKEEAKGRSKFLMQYMLDNTLSDIERYPLKCSDLIVMDCDKEIAPEKVAYGSAPNQIIKDLPYAKLIIPKLKTNKEDANDTQKELMEIISSFKKKEFVKEYIDLVNIYNQFCTENYAPDFAESFKKNLNKISLLENISVSELRDLINNYKSGVAIDSESIIDKTTEKIDYSALSFEELKNELEEIYNKLPQNTNEELYNRIYDFFISAKETDFDKLCEFMLIMDDFINNKITEKEVLNKCQEHAIKPMESYIDDWIMEQNCNELKLKINEKIQKIATYVTNNDQSSNNDSSLYSQIENYANFLDSFSVEDLITFDKNFDKMLSELKDSEKIKEIRYKFFNQLALITNNITTDNQLKNFALEIYNTNRNDISIEEAYNCLNKIDKYNSLQDDKKILIGSVLDIFNDETSSLEKKLLYEIIYNKCLEEDSVIKNEAYGVNVTITKELKQELMREYQNVFVLLKWFEEAAALKAKFKGSAGIKELGKKNKDPKYCMEIKITNKNYAQIRLYSTFATDKNGNIIKKDRYGNLIKNFVFTKLVHDHNKMEK